MRMTENIKQFLQKKNLLVSKEDRENFHRDLVKENFFRLSLISTLLFAYECFLYTIRESIYHVGHIIYPFLFFGGAMFPIIIYIYFKSKKVNLFLANIVKYIYTFICIVFGVFISLSIIDKTDFIHIYLLFVFFAGAFISLSPFSSLSIFLVTYIIFLVLLPDYVEDPSRKLVIITNTAGSNAAAGVMSVVMWRSKITVFKNRALLLKQNIKLEELSRKDSMTDLYNHETSLRILEREIKLAEELFYPLSVIIADIDDFKKVNDDFGHQYGDYIIKQVAQIIKSTARKTDYIGRYGGEEFIIIMPYTDLNSAFELSDRLGKNISGSRAFDEVKISFSGGICQWSGEKANEIIRMTDKKLFEAKASGKNCFKFDSIDNAELEI